MPEDTPKPTPDPTEPLRQQLAAANARLIQAELKSHAIQAGIVDLDGLKFIDVTKLKLTDEGNLPEAESTLATLKQAKPWLFTKAGNSSSNPGPAPRAEPPQPLTAMKMSHDEWRAARERLLRGQ